jgi:uncharacterized protein
VRIFSCFFVCLISFISLAQEPFVIGEKVEVESVILDERRELNIYLPPGYAGNDTVSYPVIYLLDGSADEDFVHVAGLLQFCNFPWVQTEPEAIIVGIANVDRERDFTFPTTIAADKVRFPTTGSAGDFMAFMESELFPYIAGHYKASEKRTILGQSLGGLMAAEILMEKPELFDRYVIVSPSMWWDGGSVLKLEPDPRKLGGRSVYIAVGKEGKVMEQGARNLYKTLKKKKRLKQIEFEYFPASSHANIYHEALMQAFEILE